MMGRKKSNMLFSCTVALQSADFSLSAGRRKMAAQSAAFEEWAYGWIKDESG